MAGAEKLIIAGNSAFAEIAYEYFTHDSPYDVVGFTVDKRFLAKDTLFGLPNVPFEDVECVFAPAEHHLYAASTYTSLNRLRTRFTVEAKRKGYRLASYVSSRAFVWRNVEIGEHCFIFEDNTVQPFVKLGNNVVLWSGNHIGHHSTVGDNVFIASHVVVSGFCAIGENTFVGVNATIANNVAIAQDNLIGAGATILRSTSENQMYGAEATKAKENRTARQYFGID